MERGAGILTSNAFKAASRINLLWRTWRSSRSHNVRAPLRNRWRQHATGGEKEDGDLNLPVCAGVETSTMTLSEEILQRCCPSRIWLAISNLTASPTPLVS
jgi:hypothetical protein